MSGAIILLPGLIAWWMAANRSVAAALFSVYLPVILMVPDYFRMPIAGLPDPGFGQVTIFPIGVGICLAAFSTARWKFSAVDGCVLAVVAWQFVADYLNMGYKEAQNDLFETLTKSLFPYMAGKMLIEQTGMRTQFARRFVWLLFLVCIISLYEFKMGESLFRPIVMRFFPGQDPGAFTQMRWGFGRIAGPYVHAIFMCSIIGIGYLLCRWVAYADQWESHFRSFPGLPFKKSTVLTAALIAGMAMTMSRGPWFGAACGAIVASVGTGLDRRKQLRRAAFILVGGSLVLYTAGKAYLDGVSAFEGVEEQASAAYRTILVDKYEEIVMLSPVYGWGHANWPKVPGMPSIDNNYLYTALGSGIVGTGLLIVLLLTAIWRIFASGYFVDEMEPEERAFRFTMCGILTGITISIATCYLAAQLLPLLYLFLGWAEACVVYPPDPPETEFEEEEEFETIGYGYMRVIA